MQYVTADIYDVLSCWCSAVMWYVHCYAVACNVSTQYLSEEDCYITMGDDVRHVHSTRRATELLLQRNLYSFSEGSVIGKVHILIYFCRYPSHHAVDIDFC